MTFHDIRKGWPLIVLGLIAIMSLIRGCSIIMSPDIQGLVTEGSISHIVFLKLNTDADKDKVIEEIKKISEIDVLHDLEVGLFIDLGDARALSGYDLAFSMNFKNESDYHIYQTDTLHLQLKESLKELLAGPPVTYDFEIK